MLSQALMLTIRLCQAYQLCRFGDTAASLIGTIIGKDGSGGTSSILLGSSQLLSSLPALALQSCTVYRRSFCLACRKQLRHTQQSHPAQGAHLLVDHADVFLSVCGLCICVIYHLPGKAPFKCKWKAGRFLSSAGGFSHYQSFCERCCDPAEGCKQQKRILADRYPLLALPAPSQERAFWGWEHSRLP